MTDNNVQRIRDSKDLPPSAQDKTYGQRVYHFLFDNLINFWLNLGISAMFTYWVHHYRAPVKIWPLKGREPFEMYRQVVSTFEKSPVLKIFKSDETRHRTAQIMGDALTLTSAGTAVMVPSVWLGAKIKEPFVKWLDKRHYGEEEVENDPRIQRQHLLMHVESRPTLFGAILGRAGTMLTVQTAAYTIGHKTNMLNDLLANKLNWSFLKKFPGIDSLASRFGHGMGTTFADTFPSLSSYLNRTLPKRHFSWSQLQEEDLKIKNIGDGIAVSTDPAKVLTQDEATYKTVMRDFFKLGTLDILYTAITSVTIHPIINLLKKAIPGMTYRDFKGITYHPKENITVVMEQSRRDDTGNEQTTDTDTPQAKVSQVQDLARVDAPSAPVKENKR